MILITGGGSFTGAALARELISAGHDVRVLVHRGAHRVARLDCELVKGDIRDTSAVRLAAAGCDTICHLAYAPAGSPPRYILHTAAAGMLAVLAACERHVIKNLLLVSSSLAAVPDPGPYGRGKLLCEEMAGVWWPAIIGSPSPRVIVARPYNLYGPGMGSHHVIPQFALAMNRLTRTHPKGIIPFPIRGSGTQSRAFCHISDAAAQLAWLLAHATAGRYDVGTTQEKTIAALAHAIARCYGREIQIVPGPVEPGTLARQVPDVWYQPKMPFSQGLAETVEWYKTHDN